MVRTTRIVLLAFVALLAVACGRVVDANAPTATSVILPPTALPTAAPNANLQATASAMSSSRGEAIFNTFYNEAGFACTTCHNPNSTETLTGPGMLGLGERAAERVEGLSAAEYIRQSIINPSAHVVEGFNDGIMPQVYSDVFNNQQLDDLVNYLLGL